VGLKVRGTREARRKEREVLDQGWGENQSNSTSKGLRKGSIDLMRKIRCIEEKKKLEAS